MRMFIGCLAEYGTDHGKERIAYGNGCRECETIANRKMKSNE